MSETPQLQLHYLAGWKITGIFQGTNVVILGFLVRALEQHYFLVEQWSGNGKEMQNVTPLPNVPTNDNDVRELARWLVTTHARGALEKPRMGWADMNGGPEDVPAAVLDQIVAATGLPRALAAKEYIFDPQAGRGANHD